MRPVGIYEKTSEKMLSHYKMTARWGAVTPPLLALTMSVCSVKISDNNLVTTEGNNTGFSNVRTERCNLWNLYQTTLPNHKASSMHTNVHNLWATTPLGHISHIIIHNSIQIIVM